MLTFRDNESFTYELRIDRYPGQGLALPKKYYQCFFLTVSSSLYTREPMLTLRDNESFTYELRNDR